MDEDKINRLSQKFLKGTITNVELGQLEAWFAENDDAPVEVSSDADEADMQRRIYRAITDRCNLNPVKINSGHRTWPRIAAAAAIVLLLGYGGFVYFTKDTGLTKQEVATDIAPGKNMATLTLANGMKIILSGLTAGQIAREAGVSIQKNANGQLVYSIADNKMLSLNQFNTLSTAKGESYQVSLPDGTQVWLNASSSLTFPVRFTGPDRKVALKGEGYFEVAKDSSHPFRVTTAGQEVRVLGTHFNINAYADEPATKTTLLEGSVKLTSKNMEKLLKPGQQAALMNDGYSIQNIDTQLATAWKNNKFIFDGERIDHIMRMVERWYNVEVVYNGSVTTEKFYGGTSRFANVSEVLKSLEATSKVNFKIEGRKIIVNN